MQQQDRDRRWELVRTDERRRTWIRYGYVGWVLIAAGALGLVIGKLS